MEDKRFRQQLTIPKDAVLGIGAAGLVALVIASPLDDIAGLYIIRRTGMNMESLVMILIGAGLGYYVVSHYVKTGQAV